MLLKCLSAFAILTSNCWYFAFMPFMPRYCYLIYMEIDGKWERISKPFSTYEHAHEAMLNFGIELYPWGILIVWTIKFRVP